MFAPAQCSEGTEIYHDLTYRVRVVCERGVFTVCQRVASYALRRLSSCRSGDRSNSWRGVRIHKVVVVVVELVVVVVIVVEVDIIGERRAIASALRATRF